MSDIRCYYIGIDPPNAVAVLDQDGGLVYSCAFKKQQASTKKWSAEQRRHQSIHDCVNSLSVWVRGRTAHIAIEGPGVAGKIGFRGMWTIGHWAGVWRGMIGVMLCRGSEIVLPREWKQAMFPGLTLNKTKAAAVAYASKHYGITDEDEAEAVCIAEYLRRRHQ